MLRSREIVPTSLLLAAACAGSPRGVADDSALLAASERLAVLAAGEVDLPPQAAESAFASTRRDFERLRARTGFATLPDPPCDFERTALLLVVASASRAGAALRHRIDTEEGVDVVTVTAPGEGLHGEGPLRSRARWFVVPARPRQLAVVLQEPGDRGALVERTLAVHAPRE